MKKLTKVLSMVMVAVMLIGMFAITATAAEGTGSITITNASIGSTYNIYKLFDASVTGTPDGGIVYTGEIPESLKTYFTKDALGQIHSARADLSEEAVAAMKAWAATATPAQEPITATADEVTFSGLDYGYYVITSTTGTGAAISIASTNPTAEIIDKNTTEWYIVKRVDDADVTIGQTVNYTLGVKTMAYWTNPETNDVEKITKYVIEDNLPAFLSEVEITAIKVFEPDGTTLNKDLTEELKAQSDVFATAKKIEVSMVDGDGNHIYPAGSVIRVYYSAKVTDSPDTVYDGPAGNINTMTTRFYTNKSGDKHRDEKHSEDFFKTYGLALRKVDNHGNPLVGAIFAIRGLKVTGQDGLYTVVSYDPNGTEGDQMVTDNNGMLIIKGLASHENVKLYEVKAPDGYNMLSGDVSFTPQVLGEVFTAESVYTYYDAEGNVTSEVTESYINEINYTKALTANNIYAVINTPGTELPETGGMGTTMFIVFGYLVALMSAVVLVARKKAAGYR